MSFQWEGKLFENSYDFLTASLIDRLPIYGYSTMLRTLNEKVEN